jgi:hypothetical protein
VLCGLVLQIAGHSRKSPFVPDGIVREHYVAETTQTSKQVWLGYIGCFKKSFTTLKEYVNLFRGHVQCFEMS